MSEPPEPQTDPRDAYRPALLDWLACAHRGAREPAARAAAAAGDGLLERVAAAGTAGHVLDFDDTYAPGLAHLSAATAPAALVLGAELGADLGTVLDAYAAGFEAMGAPRPRLPPGALRRRLAPDRGVRHGRRGGRGGAPARARRRRTRTAIALALLRAGGLRAAFGSDGKALQVGLAAATGVQAARLAAAGARVDAAAIGGGRGGFAEAFGVATNATTLDEMLAARGAIDENWIKAYPCCLQTHGAIDAALLAGVGGPPPRDTVIIVTVHPISRQAAGSTASAMPSRRSSRSPTSPPTRCCSAPPASTRSTTSTSTRRRSARGSPCAQTPRSAPTRRAWPSTVRSWRASAARAAARPTGCTPPPAPPRWRARRRRAQHLYAR